MADIVTVWIIDRINWTIREREFVSSDDTTCTFIDYPIGFPEGTYTRTWVWECSSWAIYNSQVECWNGMLA